LQHFLHLRCDQCAQHFCINIGKHTAPPAAPIGSVAITPEMQAREARETLEARVATLEAVVAALQQPAAVPAAASAGPPAAMAVVEAAKVDPVADDNTQ